MTVALAQHRKSAVSGLLIDVQVLIQAVGARTGEDVVDALPFWQATETRTRRAAGCRSRLERGPVATQPPARLPWLGFGRAILMRSMLGMNLAQRLAPRAERPEFCPPILAPA